MSPAESLQAACETLAEAVVEAEAHRLDSFPPIVAALDGLIPLLESQDPAAAVVAHKARLLAENALCGQGDGEVTLRDLTAAASAFQALAQGRSLAELRLPEHLAVATTAVSSADQMLLSELVERSAGSLEDFERCVLGLEGAHPAVALRDLRQLLHTMKGDCGLVGLDTIASVLHQVEDLLQGSQASRLVDGLLLLRDWLEQHLTLALAGEAGDDGSAVLATLATLTRGGDRAQARRVTSERLHRNVDQTSEEPATATLRPEPELYSDIEASGLEPAFLADPDLAAEFLQEAHEHLEAADQHLLSLEDDPGNAEALGAVFRGVHTIKGQAGFLSLPAVVELAHAAEQVMDALRTERLLQDPGVMDLIFDAIDALKHQLATLKDSLRSGEMPATLSHHHQLVRQLQAAAAGQLPTAEPLPEIGPGTEVVDLLVQTGRVTRADIEQLTTTARLKPTASEQQLSITQALVGEGLLKAKEAAKALRQVRNASESPAGKQAVREVMKLDAERVERVADLIGEMVIASSMVTQDPELHALRNPRLNRSLAELDKITRELQEMATALRMVPLRPTFQRMARLVRDTAKKLGKPVEFVTQGDDTELDKSVVDRIGDPLIHLLRNAVDHGLEKSPDDREAAGKPAQGRVTLSARHRGGAIYIEIRDDGRGLDRGRILAKARERGLISAEAEPSDRETWAMILEPGFSTAELVTDVSGRGVGMDVVKRNIEDLRGGIEISSEAGVGSCFSIRLPLTLAVIDGMVLRVGRERYLLPTLSMLTTLRPKAEQLHGLRGGAGWMLQLHDRHLPLCRLGELFSCPGAETDPTRAICVVLDHDGEQVAILVDELLGQMQVVIKPLGALLHGLPGISGGTITPDGTVGIILDVDGLVRLARQTAASP